MMHLSPWERRAIVGGILFAAFTISASTLFLWETGQLGDYPAPFAQWWLFVPDAGDPDIRFWLLASGPPAAALTGLGAAAWFWRKEPRRLDALAAGVLLFGAFTVLASVIFQVFTAAKDLIQTHSFHAAPSLWLAQWWLYLPYAGDPDVRARLFLSGVPAAGVVTIAAVVLYRRLRHKLGGLGGWSLRRNPPPTQQPPAPIRGTTDNFGHARWMTIEEARKLWPGADRAYGGIVVGEAYDPTQDSVAKIPFDPADRTTWGRGGRPPLLIDPCKDGSTHSLTIAGSGGFKTVGSAIPTLLNWTGAAVVLDPSCEMSPMLTKDRERLGHDVFTLHPETADTVGFNALDWIDINSPTAETDVQAVVEWICGDTPAGSGTNAFFRSRGKQLVACLLAHMLWSDEVLPELKTLRTLRSGLVTPEDELRELLSDIRRSSKSHFAQDLAGTLMGLTGPTFSGMYANADETTAWLSTRAFAGLVSGNSFRAKEICGGQVTVFISLPLKSLQSTPAVARTIIGALMNAAYEADGKVKGRILFLLDEAARLGPMKIIETARDAGRKYGISMHLLYQSVGQIIDQFGASGKRDWFNAASWIAFAAVKDHDEQKELSEICGQHSVIGWSESENQGTHAKPMEIGSRSRGTALNYQEQARPLIRPDEISELREDIALVVPRKGRPLLCGRAIYFRRAEMTSRVSANRFAPKEKEPVS